MARAIKRQRTGTTGDELPSTVGVQTQLKPSQVKITSNIFGNLASDDDDDEQDLEDDDDEVSEDDEPEIDEAGDESAPESEHDDVDGDDDEVSAARQAKSQAKLDSDSAAFSLALDKILNRDLSSGDRKDPVLARSLASRQVKAEKLDAKLDRKVRLQMTAEKKAKLDKGHDDLARFRIGGVATSHPVDDEADDEAERARVLDRERQMRKVAQRGCVRLFNAIRAAQTEVQQKVDEGALKRRARRDEVNAAREEAAATAAAAERQDGPLVKDEAKPDLLGMIMAGGV